MNKKGFTLVELVVVIGLIAILAIVIGTNMVGLQGKQNEKKFDSFKDNLESAACLYMNKSDNLALKRSCRANNNSSACIVTIEDLVEMSLIDEDIVDPRTNEIADRNISVKVRFENNEQICEFQE